jgi:hypothetical protein
MQPLDPRFVSARASFGLRLPTTGLWPHVGDDDGRSKWPLKVSDAR